MKVVVCPDSFKGTYSASEIALWITEAIRAIDAGIAVTTMPLSDGGEGFGETWNHLHKGVSITIDSLSATAKPLQSKALLLGNEFGVLECASSCGLPQVDADHDILRATSRGLGIDIRALVERGVKTIAIGLGGSATNDAGCGALSELGVDFLNNLEEAFIPTGGTLGNVRTILLDKARTLLHDVELLLYTDVLNPLTGPKGASRVFAAQKGASAKDIEILEGNMGSFQKLLHSAGVDTDQAGMGAAGGIPAGFSLLPNVTIKSGIEAILDGLGFAQHIRDADLVITGEGRLDEQSFDGKVLSGLIDRLRGSRTRLVSLSATVTLEGLRLAGEHGVECCSLFLPKTPAIRDVTALKARLQECVGLILG